jgi:acetyl-CoA C-acetyltransferase
MQAMPKLVRLVRVRAAEPFRSMATRRGDGPLMMDSGNLRLRAKQPQSHQGICADAIATFEGISREDTDRLALLSQQRAAAAIVNGYFSKSLVPVFHEGGRLALDKEEYPRPQTTLEGLAALKPAFPAVADFPLDDKGTTYRGLILQKYPDLQITIFITPAIRRVLSTDQQQSCWHRRATPKNNVA